MAVTFTKKPKAPDTTLDYPIDWSLNLAEDDDTITASEWLIDIGLTKESESFEPTSTVVWVSGGTLGTQYNLTNHITTVGGRIEDFTFIIVCEQT